MSLVLWPLGMALFWLQVVIGMLCMLLLWPLVHLPKLVADSMRLLWAVVVTLPQVIWFVFAYSDYFRLINMFKEDIHNSSYKVADSSLVQEINLLQITAVFCIPAVVGTLTAAGDNPYNYLDWGVPFFKGILHTLLTLSVLCTIISRTGIFICWSLARHYSQTISQRLGAQSGLELHTKFWDDMKECLKCATTVIVMFGTLGKVTLAVGIVLWGIWFMPEQLHVDGRGALVTFARLFGVLVVLMVLQCFHVNERYQQLINPSHVSLEDIPWLTKACGWVRSSEVQGVVAEWGRRQRLSWLVTRLFGGCVGVQPQPENGHTSSRV